MTTYERAMAKFGKERQMRKLQEECAELAAEVNKYLEGRSSLDELLGEMADVSICLEQMRCYFTNTAIDTAIARKLMKLEKYLEAP